MSATPAKPSYPHPCPHCEDGTGWPFSAGTCDRPGIIVVKLRCQKCSHEWITDAPKPVMAPATLWPKRPDRRRNGPSFGSR